MIKKSLINIIVIRCNFVSLTFYIQIKMINTGIYILTVMSVMKVRKIKGN